MDYIIRPCLLLPQQKRKGEGGERRRDRGGRLTMLSLLIAAVDLGLGEAAHRDGSTCRIKLLLSLSKSKGEKDERFFCGYLP